MRVACYTRKSSALEKPALWSEIHSLAAMAGLRPSATKPRLAPFPTLLRQTEDFSRARVAERDWNPPPRLISEESCEASSRRAQIREHWLTLQLLHPGPGKIMTLAPEALGGRM